MLSRDLERPSRPSIDKCPSLHPRLGFQGLDSKPKQKAKAEGHTATTTETIVDEVTAIRIIGEKA